MTLEDLRAQCDIKTEHTSRGGQHVGRDMGVITITHRELGIVLTLPPQSSRSQHRRIQAGLDAMMYLVFAL